MTENLNFYLRMLAVVAWAICGISIIINFIEEDYPTMMLFVVLMLLNATMYSIHKKYVP